jgi:Uma2 family endonuclease
MAMQTIELPRQETQRAFNLRRWAELQKDTALAQVEGRIETDRLGRIIMSPPAAPSHGSFQIRIGHLLTTLMSQGRVISQCPISTAHGVKAADVAWASPERLRALGKLACFLQAPELCVEILSPSNSAAQVQAKIDIYFDAGAREVWICGPSGAMTFFLRGEPRPRKTSELCPKFPRKVELP